jgi:hypothetical protein
MPPGNKTGPSRYRRSKQRVIRRAYAHGDRSIGAHDKHMRAILRERYLTRG